MKLIILSISILSIITFESFAKEVKFKTVSNEEFEWGDRFRLLLELPSDWNDPGDFTQIKIFNKEKLLYSKKNLQSQKIKEIENFPEYSINVSPFCKLIPSKKDRKPHQALLVFSNWLGGSSPDETIMLGQKKSGAIYMAFKGHYKIKSIMDYDGDGKLDILVTGGRGESFSENAFSYDPYLVLKQKDKMGMVRFIIDEELSRKWSLENKYEWQGSKYSSKIKIDSHGKLITE